MKVSVTVSAELKNDLKKALTQYKVGMAAVTRDELVMTAAAGIHNFYESYTPLYYDRHYYNFRKNSFTGYYNNPHNSIVRGGVELTPENLDHVYERASVDLIFNLVFVAGMHGNMPMVDPLAYNPPPMTPSPYEMILNKRDYMIDNISKYSNQAYHRMKVGSYKTLKVR